MTKYLIYRKDNSKTSDMMLCQVDSDKNVEVIASTSYFNGIELTPEIKEDILKEVKFEKGAPLGKYVVYADYNTAMIDFIEDEELLKYKRENLKF